MNSVVQVYAQEENDLQLHPGCIMAFNVRSDSSTQWKEEVYAGYEYFEKMARRKQSKKKRDNGKVVGFQLARYNNIQFLKKN